MIQAAEIITDRPDQTESSSAVGYGVTQIEFGWMQTFERTGPLEARLNEFPQALVRIGLKSGFELRIGWDGYAFMNPSSALGDSFHGSGDASIGAKIDLWKEDGPTPQAALLIDVTLPIGRDSFTSNRVDPSALISLSNELSEIFSLGCNLGVTSSSAIETSGKTETSVSGLYTIALGAGLTETYGAFLEIFGEKRFDQDEAPLHSLDGGLTALFSKDIQLDIAAGFGLSSGAPDWFITSGLSIRLQK